MTEKTVHLTSLPEKRNHSIVPHPEGKPTALMETELVSKRNPHSLPVLGYGRPNTTAYVHCILLPLLEMCSAELCDGQPSTKEQSTVINEETRFEIIEIRNRG